jgi:PTH1 family peptidyl-tRNA hydrolase
VSAVTIIVFIDYKDGTHLHRFTTRATAPMGLLAVVRKVVTAPMRLIEKVRGHGSGGSEAGRWLLVGLGNPGSRFEGTRHNAGFDVLDILARTEGISWTDASRHRAKVGVGKIAGVPVLLAKPQTYMNLSGESVRSLCRWYKIPNSNLLVVYDDLDTAVGAIKLKGKGGHGGHNGIRNIIDEVCGDKVFARLKFGIGRPKGGVEVYDHVLTRFGGEETTELESKGTWTKACDAVRAVLMDGLDKAMSGVNTEHKAPKPAKPKQPKQAKKPKPAAAAVPPSQANEGDAPVVTVGMTVQDDKVKVELAQRVPTEEK